MCGGLEPSPPVVLRDRETAAVAVLDLSVRCNDPATPCSKLIHPVGEFLERVRATSVPIVYSISLRSRGTEMGEVAPPDPGNNPTMKPMAIPRSIR